MYLEPRSIALFIKSLNVGVGRSQNLREHLGPSPFECWDPEQLPFARLRIAMGVCWTQIPCEGCSFSYLMGRHTVPGTTGISSEEGEPQGPSVPADRVFSCPTRAPSKLCADDRCMCCAWFALGQFLAEEHSSCNSPGDSLALTTLSSTFSSCAQPIGLSCCSLTVCGLRGRWVSCQFAHL